MAMGLTVNVMQTVSLMGMMTVLWPQRLVTKPKAGKLLFFMFYHVVIISYLRFFSSVSRSCESVRRNFAGLAGT
jgi:hypothetical protein